MLKELLNRVAQEVYSLFIEQLIFTSCDGRMHFLLVIQPEFGEEEFKIVEKTLFHFYINYSLFAVQFCRLRIHYVMVRFHPLLPGLYIEEGFGNFA